MVITSNNHEAAGQDTAVDMAVFIEVEGLAYLAERTGRDDVAGARELGWLPLALAQAAAVIAAQRLDSRLPGPAAPGPGSPACWPGPERGSTRMGSPQR